jgi:hypothetical protein
MSLSSLAVVDPGPEQLDLVAAVNAADPSSLPALIDRARRHLETARTSAEVIEAHRAAETARHFARLIHAANETQADCLRLVIEAERRMVEELEAGQTNGQVAGWGGDRKSIKPQDAGLDQPVTYRDLGLDDRRVSEWRQLAHADPLVLEERIARALVAGKAPTHAELLTAAKTALKAVADDGKPNAPPDDEDEPEVEEDPPDNADNDADNADNDAPDVEDDEEEAFYAPGAFVVAKTIYGLLSPLATMPPAAEVARAQPALLRPQLRKRVIALADYCVEFLETLERLERADAQTHAE